MKLMSIAALALLAAAPAFATPALSVNFEKTWAYGEAVDNTYAADGVTFTNVLGFSNDGVSVGYSNAPSPLGIAFVQLDHVSTTSAFMNLNAGLERGLLFYYSSAAALTGAVKAYSGLNGTGDLLASIDLSANDSGAYDSWTQAALLYNGTALSFDLTGTEFAAVDNLHAAPEPTSYGLVLVGLLAAGVMTRRRQS